MQIDLRRSLQINIRVILDFFLMKMIIKNLSKKMNTYNDTCSRLCTLVDHFSEKQKKLRFLLTIIYRKGCD